ncbi:MAG: phosphodiester glycosidase family protein [Oscillospiraceae bacterium]|nr:phosphodiester glycosidase family protein [Oscillospiraceae bacterium]
MSYLRNREGKFSASRRKPKKMSLPLLILTDALLVGLILVVFAFFHHVLPAITNELAHREQLQTVTEAPETQPPETAAPETEPVPAVTEETEPPTEETEPPVDDRTEWQIKFAEHFTDEVVVTENSYSSPNVSITIETVTEGEGDDRVVYHVADIYIGSPECFTTYTADNEMRYFGTQDVMEMDEAANAILSISGDFLTYQKSGFLMRNREVYVSDSNANSLCVLFEDGSMETYDGKEYTIEDITARGAVQVWSFGPNLLDENGMVRDSYKVSTAVSYTNPRSAVGYYEPGHYCFVVVDGRQKGYSNGMTIPELAAVFQELGCASAYNLDGGGSAVMVFNHERYSQQSNGGDRSLGDILVIREPAAEQEDGA